MHRALILAAAAISGGATFAVINAAISQTSPDLAFESLSACQKLDVIESSGKSVEEYITDSGYQQFDTAIRTDCTRHIAALNEALTQEGLDPDFEALSACQQLDIIASDGKSLTNFIYISGIEKFEAAINADCSRYLPVLREAQTLSPRIGGPTNPVAVEPSGTIFPPLPPCERLRIIDSARDKSVIDYIALSGYEEFDDAIRSRCPNFRPDLDAAIRQVGLDPAFEALPACQKLDAIAAKGESITDYIIDSGIDDFAEDIGNNCREKYLGNLTEARNRLRGHSE